MIKNTHIYILLKIVTLKNPYMILNCISLLYNYASLNYTVKTFLFFNVTNTMLLNINKKKPNYFLNSLIPVEVAVKNSISNNKPVYFLPINGDVADTNLINVYLNNFKPITNIDSLLQKRKYRNIKKLIINNYNPSLLICINSFQNFKLISNIKTLGIPSIGLVDNKVIHSPFEISIYVPVINSYFQIYYFFLMFKLVVYYKKLYMKYLIYNFINLKLIYLKNLWLLK